MNEKMILAVDDRPEILTHVTDALSGVYKVYGLTDSKSALAFIENRIPDLFILDIEMPVLNGFELAKLIRELEVFAETPIIFMTGHTSPNNLFKALNFSKTDFIVKPSAHDTILAKVNQFLA